MELRCIDMCYSPISIKDGHGNEVNVPCGKCPKCKLRRESGWSFRLLQEAKSSIHSHFITMTYGTHSVPITPKGYMSLCKRDYQLFFKRLRRLHERRRDWYCNKYGDWRPIKFCLVGEYGTIGWRPHYHALVFNSCPELIDEAWRVNNVMIGDIYYGDVEGASVGYVLKYMCKPGKVPMHKNDDRLPEFFVVSRGIGIAYLTQEMFLWHHADLENRMYCNLTGGKKIAMPRYYKNLLYDSGERDIVAFAGAQRAIDSHNSDIKKGIEMYGSLEAYEKALFESRSLAYKKMYSSQEKRKKV